MMVEDISQVLSDGSVYLDVGPMQMRIHVWRGERVDSDRALAGAEKAYSLLQELSAHKSIISSYITEVDVSSSYPQVVNRMIGSVKKAGDPSMTPLAAVAGTVADEVADFICSRGPVSKIIVNNGGDIAIRLRGDSSARIGIQEDITRGEFSSLLVLEEHHRIGGIATSGVGGRSLTRGIASAVTVAASSASFADAAATLIANAVDVESPVIKRAPARTIDPDTDIPHLPVTASVGHLSQREVEEALGAGLEAADELSRQDLIKGAILVLRGSVVISNALSTLVQPAMPPTEHHGSTDR